MVTLYHTNKYNLTMIMSNLHLTGTFEKILQGSGFWLPGLAGMLVHIAKEFTGPYQTGGHGCPC